MIEQRIAHTPREANAAANELYAIAKARTAAGKRVLLRLVDLDPEWRRVLRGAFHGDVLRQISEQARVRQPDGTVARYTVTAWKALLKEMFLPDGFESTESLDDEQYAEFLLQSAAFGAMDLGVEFESDRGAH